MKKIAYFILGALIVLAPFTASAIEALSADSMKAATGQAGVTIGIDDVILYQNTGDKTYYDADGGGVKITGNESLLFINAIDDSPVGTYDTQYNYSTMIAAALDKDNVNMGLSLAPKALTIDVDACTVINALEGGNKGGVIIGLPTLELYDALANKSQTISLVHDSADTYENQDAAFIRIDTTGSTMAILGGTLEIAPH